MEEGRKFITLGEVASFSRGLTFAKGDVASSSSKRVLRSNNIDLETSSLNFDDVACLKEEFLIPQEKKLRKNDIFICMSNGSTQHLGKVAFISENIDYAFGGFMGAIHPNPLLVYPKYVYFSCLSLKYRRFLASIFNGININNLKWSDLSKYQIPIPPIPEQERIVAELDLLTDIIDKQKTQLKELDTLASSIFYDMFGNPVDNTKGWKMERLQSLCSSLFAGGDVPKDSLSDIKTAEFAVPIISNGVGDKALYGYTRKARVFDESITISGRGTIGYCEVRTQPFFPVVRLIVATPDKTKILPIVLKFIVDSLPLRGNGGAIPQLTIPMVKDIQIILPPIELQQSFADKIEVIERQKANINASIAETQKLFDYTMDKYFG